MNNERRDWVLLATFGFVVACAGMSASRWVTGSLVSFWAMCCFDAITLGGLWVPAFMALSRGAVGVSVLIGSSVLVRRLWKTSGFVSRLKKSAVAEPSARLAKLFDDLSLSQHVVVLATEVPLAFCVGLLRPRICLTTGLSAILSDPELKAVLLHEDHHRRRFDPLRGLLADMLAAMLFFLPVAAELRHLFLTATELAADRHAVQSVGRPPLAGALHKILTHPLAPHIAPVGIAGISATQVRIAELLGDRPTVVQVSAKSLIISSAVVMLVCMAVL